MECIQIGLRNSVHMIRTVLQHQTVPYPLSTNSNKFSWITLIQYWMITHTMTFFIQNYKLCHQYLTLMKSTYWKLYNHHFHWNYIVNILRLERLIFLCILSSLKTQIMNLMKLCWIIFRYKNLLIPISMNITKKCNLQIMIPKLFI